MFVSVVSLSLSVLMLIASSPVHKFRQGLIHHTSGIKTIQVQLSVENNFSFDERNIITSFNDVVSAIQTIKR
jgi:hypothetical protein